MASFLDIFRGNEGPSPSEKEQRFLSRAENLDPKDWTVSNLHRIAAEEGFREPSKAPSWFFKLMSQRQSTIQKFLPEEEGQQTRQALEQFIPSLAPRFDPEKKSIPLTAEELTGLVASAAPDLPVQSFLESSREQDVGKRLQVTAPLAGFENLPASVRDPLARDILEKSLLPGAEGETPLNLGTKFNSAAFELFGVNTKERLQNMTPGQVKAVNNLIQRRDLEQRAEEGSAKAQAELNFELRQQRGQVVRVIAGINEVQNKIVEDPAVLGVPGALSRAITSLSDQAKSLVNIVVPGAYETFHNIEKYGNIFRDAGIESGKVQSQLLGLAIGMALAEGFQGRGITDRKIELNLRRLTGAVGSGSAEIAFSVLEQLKTELTEGFNAVADSASKDLSKVPIIPSSPPREFIGGTGKLPEGLPEGSVRIGTKDGKPLYESPDGRRFIVE